MPRLLYLLVSPRQTIRGLHLLCAHPGFAPTQVLPGSDRAACELALRLFGCGCGKDHLVRVFRQRWMRLLPVLRLYACRACGQRVLRPRMRARPGYGGVYLPAAPLK